MMQSNDALDADSQSGRNKRRLYVAWSQLLGSDESSPRDCGLIRITDATAQMTLFTYMRSGHMTDENGNEINVDVMDAEGRWISDVPVVIGGVKSTGSRWAFPTEELYLFLGWQIGEYGEIEPAGFGAITNADFSQVKDKFDVTISAPPGP